MMGIVVPETCWAFKKYNKIISGFWLVFILQLSQWCTVQQTSNKKKKSFNNWDKLISLGDNSWGRYSSFSIWTDCVICVMPAECEAVIDHRALSMIVFKFLGIFILNVCCKLLGPKYLAKIRVSLILCAMILGGLLDIIQHFTSRKSTRSNTTKSYTVPCFIYLFIYYHSACSITMQ